MRIVGSWLLAVIVGVIVGGLALGFFDQQSWLEAAGGAASLSLGDRLSWFVQTLYGLVFTNGTGLGFGLYPVLVAVAMLIGLSVAALFVRWAPSLRFWWYAGAGAVAMVTIFIALEAAVGMMAVPGARTAAGLAVQGVAGFVAGAAFALASRRR